MRKSIIKPLIIATLNLILLLLLGEVSIRIKYFLQHQYDIRYLVTPYIDILESDKKVKPGKARNKEVPKVSEVYCVLRSEWWITP